MRVRQDVGSKQNLVSSFVWAFNAIAFENKTRNRHQKRDNGNACRNPRPGICRLPIALARAPLVIQPILRSVAFCRTEGTSLID